MIRRLTDFVTGLAALLALLALTVGVPIALAVAVGWPLPTTVPSLTTIERSVSSGIDHHVIIKTLALIAWAAWLQIALTVIVETVALARGRIARPLRVLPGLQGGIGRLVTTAALVLTSLLPNAGQIASASASAPASTAAFDAYRAPIALVLPDTATVPSVTTPAEETVTAEAMIAVERHDSYWAIAERVFDDGTRWREIRDYNVGRTMSDGTTITADSETLHPGWQLHLPPTATPPPTASAAPATGTVAPETASRVVDRSGIDVSADGGTVVVEAGDNLWTIAEDHLADTLGRDATNAEIADYWQQLIQANSDHLITGDPSLIYPGQQFTLPPVPGQPPAIAEADLPILEQPAAEPPAADAPVVGPANTEPVAQTAPTPPTDASPESPSTLPPPTTLPTDTTLAPPTAATEPTAAPIVVATSAIESADRSSMIAGIGLLGIAGTGLGVGILRTLRRNRRRHNYLHPDTIPPDDIDDTDIQRAVATAADHDSYTTLTATLDQLGRSLPADTTTRPRLVQHGPGHLDVLLTQPATTAVNGWQPEAGGSIWTRTKPTDRTLEDELDNGSSWGPAAPLLVALGRPDDTGDQLYIDLEANGLTALTGDHNTALSVARSFVTELAYSPLAERINLVIVGDLDTPAASRLERVTTVEDWDDISGDLTAWAEQSHRIHTERNWPNSFIARARHDHDALTPLVIIAATPPDDPDLGALLVDLRPASIAVVSVGPAMNGASAIDCATERLTITDLGLTCEPQTITAAAVEQITDLLDPADDSLGEPIHITTGHDPDPHTFTEDPCAGALDGEPPVATLGPMPTAYTDPTVDVIVRVLGDIRVDGDTKPMTPKQTAVVAYIALQQPVSIDRLEDAVWAAPSTGPRRKRLLNTVSECRGALGATNLPAATNDGRYTTADTVITDIELFDRRVSHAANQTPVDAIETLRGALDLVTGPVFTYRSADRHSFAWVDVENWVSRWEPKIAAVAQHLAQLCLDHHDPTAAIDVADHALRIVPTHTGLTETLMRAHAANADHTSIEAVYRAHAAALEQLDIDDVADSTLELYKQLHRTRADVN